MACCNRSFLRTPCCLQLRAVPVGSQEAGASPWDHVLEMQGQLSVKGEEDIPAAEESGCFLGLYAGEVRTRRAWALAGVWSACWWSPCIDEKGDAPAAQTQSGVL